MVVTPGATQSQAQHRNARRCDHVVEVIKALASSLFLHQVVGKHSVRPRDDEAGRGNGPWIVRFKFVAGELPAHDGVERKVVIQTADDEVAKMMGRAPVCIAFLSIAVGVTHHIEPVTRPAFPVMRAGQELIDE